MYETEAIFGELMAAVERQDVEALAGFFGTEPVFVSEIGPVIGAHVGPGLIGAGGVPRSLID